jgi:uncharacterized protein YeaO (DUF488 family)
VDHLWPRGLSREAAALDGWLKDVAPSDELRKWFHAHRQQWTKFREKYLKELSTKKADTALQQLYELEKQKRHVTLLYSSTDEERNNAVVLKEVVEGGRKPPKGTGPVRVSATKRARAAKPK